MQRWRSSVAAGPALAIFGLGDIVFDPTNYEEAVQQLLQLEQQYSQLVQTYQMIQNQYQQMLWMAQQVPVNMAARYRRRLHALAHVFRHQYLRHDRRLGSTGINTRPGRVQAGYAGATQPLGTYGAAPGQYSGRSAGARQDELRHGRTDRRRQSRRDADAWASCARNAPAVEAAIQNLEDDSLSSDPDMNTEIAVLNKINAAGMIAVRNSQDTNKLLVALAEQQIIEAKRQRDAEAAGHQRTHPVHDRMARPPWRRRPRTPAPPCSPGACRRRSPMPPSSMNDLFAFLDAAHDRARRRSLKRWAPTCFAALP